MVQVLERLCDAEACPDPDRVLTDDLAGTSDAELTELRGLLFDADACRLRLAGAIGARLALQALDAGGLV